MSRFGVRKYSDPGFVYGDSGGFSSLSVDPFSATAVDYDRVALSWLSPTGAYSQIRLVRNQSGVSDTAEDGVILLNESVAATTRDTRTFVDAFDSVASYVNYVPLVPGQYAYYSIWLFLSNDHVWYQAGNAVTLIADQHETLLSTFDGSGVVGGRTRNTHEKVMDLLPRVFTSSGESPTDEVDQGGALYNFLYGFSYTLDEFLTYIDLLAPHADMTNLPPSMLNTASYELALSTDNRASTRFQRQLVREAKWLYNRKGTASALQTYVESMTGYGTTVIPSPNLLLSPQDSTFNDWQSYSDWLNDHSATITGISNATGSRVTFNAPNKFVPGQTVHITGVNPPVYNTASAVVVAQNTLAGTFTIESSAMGAYVSGGTAQSNYFGGFTLWTTVGAVTLTSSNTVKPPTGEVMAVDATGTAKVTTTAANQSISLGNDKPITRGIPVTGGQTYALTFYQQGTTGTVKSSGTWYDIFGTKISNVPGTAVAATTSWTRMTQTVTAPANAAYLGFDVTFSVASTYWVDMFQVAPGTTVTAATGASGTVTYTAPNSFQVGDLITVSGLDAAALNLSNVLVATASATSFTVESAATGTATTTGSATHAFHEARGVTVLLAPNKQNVLTNPSFETAPGGVIAGWSATGAALSQTAIDGTHPGPLAQGTGNNLGRLVPSGGPVVLTATGYNALDIRRGQFHAFSIYARNATDAAQFDATVTLTAHASGAADISNTFTYSSVGAITSASSTGSQVTYVTGFTVPVGAQVSISGVNPSSYNVANATVTSTTPFGFTIQQPVSEPYVSGGSVSYSGANRISPDWRRFWVTLFIPANFGTGPITLTPSLSYTGTQQVQVDAAQLELRYSPTDYIDGDYVDAIWGLGQVNAHKSDSFMYQNWTYKVPRLADELDVFMPSGTPFILSRVDGIATTISGAAIKGYAP